MPRWPEPKPVCAVPGRKPVPPAPESTPPVWAVTFCKPCGRWVGEMFHEPAFVLDGTTLMDPIEFFSDWTYV